MRRRGPRYAETRAQIAGASAGAMAHRRTDALTRAQTHTHRRFGTPCAWWLASCARARPCDLNVAR
eukprot:5992100-Lingulodinium_polyedra.AAC.1